MSRHWRFYVEYVRPKLVASGVSHPNKEKESTVSELIDAIEKSINYVWFGDSWNYCVHHLAEVLEKISARERELLKLLEIMPPLPHDPEAWEGVERGNPDFWFADEYADERSKLITQYREELEAYRRSLEPVRPHVEYIKTLCNKVHEAEKFAVRVNELIGFLNDMERDCARTSW